MRYTLLILFLFIGFFSKVNAQSKNQPENTVITYEKKKTEVIRNKNGELLINVSPKDLDKFKTKGFVSYSDFGAKGDGKTDDMPAIAATHEFANQQNMPVKANDDATYYISGKSRTALVRTNTDFGKASFIIDDSEVENRNSHVFLIGSDQLSFKPEGITSLKRNQQKIDVSLP